MRFVSNITDIDDKLITKANEEGVSMQEVARRYEAEFLKDCEGLNVLPPTVRPRATEHIDEILSIVADIIEKGYGYVAKNGDVYFRARKFKEYGKLSHLNLDELESGNRSLRHTMEDDLKEDPADFAVWKAAKPGEPYWDSPYGPGRPGWHIECSAMARKHLGETIDIHAGGEDLIFPHHENEIAQSECANGCEFAHYWMHNAFLNIDNRKMSKSAGNFFTVREIAQKYGYEDVYKRQALHTPGGVLVYGIPEFRLPKEIVRQEIDGLKKIGVDVETNVVIGRTLTIDELFEMGNEAVFIGSGAGLPRFMGIPGESLNGVYSVSYTHLDVYKRQPVCCTRPPPRTASSQTGSWRLRASRRGSSAFPWGWSISTISWLIWKRAFHH